jgi:PilZ domain
MGLRREPRTRMRVAVRIFGTDRNGRTFSENVFTSDVSRSGVKLEAVPVEVALGETIGLSYKSNRGRFQVKWLSGLESQRALGLQNISPEKPLWDFALPPAALDNYAQSASGKERRRHARLKSVNSVELHAESQGAPIWGKVSDLSLGGCFVEMPMPLKKDTRLKVGLWLGQEKLWLEAKVASSRPGFGVGIEFLAVPAADADKLRVFLRSITHHRW